MNLSRREFLSGTGLGVAAMMTPGCFFPSPPAGVRKARIALQLYSICEYIAGRKAGKGRAAVVGAGLDRALEDVAAIGYSGVEFDGSYYQYEHDPRGLRRALANVGLKPCGTHVECSDFGLDTKKWTYDPEVLKRTCDFNLSFGNSLIVCPGGGNRPPGCKGSVGITTGPCPPSQEIDDFTKRLADHYNRVAADAAKAGCRIGLHNHAWEHVLRMQDGTTFWDYFFTNTDAGVCMEQDVGWTTCAGADPKAQYEKYPHRSPTLHAKENGMGRNVKSFDAILGRPGLPDAVPVDWDGLVPVAEKDGVRWFVVECEKHFDDLSAVLPSYDFLRTKGLK